MPKEPKCLEARFDYHLFSKEWYSVPSRHDLSSPWHHSCSSRSCSVIACARPVLPRSRPLRFTFGQAVRQTTGGSWDLSNTCTCFEGAVSDTKFSLGHCRERDVPDYSRSHLVCKPVDQPDGGAQLPPLEMMPPSMCRSVPLLRHGLGEPLRSQVACPCR